MVVVVLALQIVEQLHAAELALTKLRRRLG